MSKITGWGVLLGLSVGLMVAGCVPESASSTPSTGPELSSGFPPFVRVQAALAAHDCARAGCHDTAAPVLKEHPTTTAQLHANYLSFSSQAESVVLDKLIAGSTPHGGVVQDRDRKPCSSESVQPCELIQAWYAAGTPEF